MLPFFPLYGEIASSVHAGNIIGHVFDSTTHLPIAGAHIDVMRGNKIITSVLTDLNGSYYVSGLESKPYLIRVNAPLFQSGVQLGIPISGETITIDFNLNYPSGALTGQIMNALTMEPIVHATVDIIKEGIVVESVKSDEKGCFSITEIVPNTYAVRATASNFQASTLHMTVLTDQTGVINFALDPSGTVVGQVIHAFTGQPISGACVGMWQDNALITYSHTDTNGYFSFNGLGHYQLVVQISHFKDLTQAVQIFPLQTSTLNFSLACMEPSPPTNVRGKIIQSRLMNRVNRINCIKWNPSSDPFVTSYRIYREDKFIAEILAGEPLVYNDEWRKKKKYTYLITAVNAFGQESIPVPFTIKK